VISPEVAANGRSTATQRRGMTCPTVVRLPAEIDTTNAHRVGDDLQAAFAAGATTVVADMTGTTFCDSLGIRALVLARKQAIENGAELRVVPSGTVLRVLAVLDPDGWLAVFPTLDEALAREPVLDTDASLRGVRRTGR
jgi:anti-sigma B factor antagonist